MGRKRWSVQAEVKGMKQWLGTTYHTFAQEQGREVLESDSEFAEIRPMASASTKLDLLGNSEGALGCVRVIEGDPGGWNHLQASTLASAWHLALLARLATTHGRLKTGLADQNLAALTLAQAIALREDAVAHWIGGVFVAGMGGPGPFAHWRRNPFPPFVTKLYARWRRGDIDVEREGVEPLGVYHRVFDEWQGGAALAEICDYHEQRSSKGDQGPPALFTGVPCIVFPAEVIALRRVRADLGLPTPTVEHQLLASPLAEVPDPLPPMTQPYHVRLREKAEAYLAALRNGSTP